ncbi:hypothetical protein WJX84_001565 [Apatococcus fuscideae]|uniref:Ubiquitin-like protease family profile domain-containing protein n=1 Tax=Apatococcus fuscideae TaxID=2026836 RepID=A0AAW1SE59_9CHLO
MVTLECGRYGMQRLAELSRSVTFLPTVPRSQRPVDPSRRWLPLDSPFILPKCEFHHWSCVLVVPTKTRLLISHFDSCPGLHHTPEITIRLINFMKLLYIDQACQCTAFD